MAHLAVTLALLFAQSTPLTAAAGAAGDRLGFSVALSANGSTIVAGAPSATISGHAQQGAVYVFVRRAGRRAQVTQTTRLTVPGGGAGDLLGISVAVSGDGSTIVAGAQDASVSGRAGQGAAYVFRRPARGWSSVRPAAELTASKGAAGDSLGTSVGISASGATIAAGAEQATVAGDFQQGAVYMFARPIDGWGSGAQLQHQVAELTASNGGQSDYLGYSVSVSADGSTIIAGAPFAAVSSSLGGQGAAYVFARPAAGWGAGAEQQHEVAELTASDGAPGDTLGISVAVSGDGSTVAAGAVGATVDGHASQGAVYAFLRTAGGWASGTQTAKLVDPHGSTDDDLGGSVAVSGTGAAIAGGALAATASGHPDQGILDLFTRPAAGWGTGGASERLTDVPGAARDYLGSSLALPGAGSAVVSGASGATVTGHRGQGAVYVFSRSRRASSATALRCRPASIAAGQTITCTVTVDDTGELTPTGRVTLSSGAAGRLRFRASCRLTAAAGAGVASCKLSFKPNRPGVERLVARYAGDAANLASVGSASTTVRRGVEI